MNRSKLSIRSKISLAAFLPLCALLVLFAAPALQGASGVARAANPVYVRTDGDDTECTGAYDLPYPGGTYPQDCAKQTVDAAVDAVDPSGMIYVAAGTYPGTNVVHKDVTIQGAGRDTTIIDAGGTTYGIIVNTGNVANIYDLTVRNANWIGLGGGVINWGTLMLQDCIVEDSFTPYGGGGIYNDGTLAVSRCIIQDNSAGDEYGGGGIYNLGPMTIQDSIIRNNHADAHIVGGGGILNKTDSGEIVYIKRTTISGNTAIFPGAVGGGLNQGGIASVQMGNVTISGNTSDPFGGGIFASGSGGMNIQNSTIANNNVSGSSPGGIGLDTGIVIVNSIVAGNANGDCLLTGSGSIASLGHNLEGGTSCGFTSTGDMQNTNPLLGPLQDNGGLTPTMGLLTNSPAIDQGDKGYCDSGNVGGVDQRGVGRPQRGHCDIGAFERIDHTPADFSSDSLSDVVVFRAGAWRFFDYATATFDHGVWTGTSPGCIPAPMDYDGDGKVEFTQLCDGSWHFYFDNGTYNKGIWTGGVPGDLPVPADYDGDGVDDVVVWRAGAWRFFNFASGAFDHGVWTGSPPHLLGGTNIPVAMDYDGDGADEFTVFSGGPWHFYNDDGSYNKGIWTGGVAGDLPVPGDYDADETEEVVVWRAGAWRIFDFNTGLFETGVWTGSPPHWLGGTSIPAPLDVDGDWKVEFSVWSGGPWHFYNDDGSYDRGIWTGGVAGDVPISRRLLIP